MRVEVTKTIKTKETVDVTFPYYYKHDLMLDEGDFVIYGKIDEKEHVSIKISVSYRSDVRGVEVEKQTTNWHSVSCYLEDEYRSNVGEYEQAKSQAMEAIKSA